jgi:hypothetical protein
MAFQYAAKLICGVSNEGPGLANGIYETLINVHNPGRERQEFRYKLALAKEAADGKIYPFRPARIEPDGAQFYSCRDIRKLFEIPGTALIDGFFVIESGEPLDVIAVYTTNDLNKNGTPAIEVERVFERAISAVSN